MPTSYGQRDRSPVDQAADESDSDLDIDPHELDETAGLRDFSQDGRQSDVLAHHGRRGARRESAFAGRIPLRNLSARGTRASVIAPPTTVATSRPHPVGDSTGDEGLDSLLQDDPRDIGGSGEAGHAAQSDEDESPLLLGNSHEPSRPQTHKSLSQRLQLWPWLRSSGPRTTGPLASIERAEKAEDHFDPTATRTIHVGRPQSAKYPPNAISNAKYNAWTFLPLTLYNEFSFFLNLYFLLVALSQIVPALRIGYLSTYVAPLIFVLSVTLGKEAVDDLARRRRDTEANAEGYTVLQFSADPRKNISSRRRGPIRRFSGAGTSAIEGGPSKALHSEPGTHRGVGLPVASGEQDTTTTREIVKRSQDLVVGDVLKLQKGQRVPADVVILASYSSEISVTDTHPSLPSASNATHESSLFEDDTGTAGVRAEDLEVGPGDALPSDGASSDAANGSSGETFIRTEQLDGETDWKLRLASPLTQRLGAGKLGRVQITASEPERNINIFVGTIRVGTDTDRYSDRDDSGLVPPSGQLSDTSRRQSTEISSSPLTIDNTAWANTILASNSTTFAAVVYTGPQTRQALSTSQARSKTGLLEYEINALTKILCVLTLALSMILVGLERIEADGSGKWYIAIPRFIILFSTIIPISLRVNLDMGKTVYSWFIEKDQDLKGAVVRTSTIPEELGRIEYLLSDKTGTLTQNEMEMKKIHIGTVSYANEAMEEVASYVQQAFDDSGLGSTVGPTHKRSASAYGASLNASSTTRSRREISSRVRDIVLALALCHNVTPTTETKDGERVVSYQASSPDEIAIVRWLESVGLRLSHRDRKTIALESTRSSRTVIRVRILEIFPFSSETKRMGIIVQFVDGPGPDSVEDPGGEVWFYEKGADTVMATIVATNDWLEEETSNMAREGLRTLVVGRKKLSAARYAQFSASYRQASLSLRDRDRAMAAIVHDYLEQDLELLGVTGVEDKLQRDVKPSIELLRNAGIKIWMLTGDKVETARCVAVSARLIARGQYVHTIAQLKSKDVAQDALDFLRGKTDASLVVDGQSLALLLAHYREAFTSVAVLLPTVIACRCSPTQKAEIAQLIRSYTAKRVCCIGDGGNDVSMIQAADVGVGIVGKEGHQASLAADFSIEQFCHLPKLLVWHGRNSYKRSAKLAQFVIHRGLIISVCQTMFSIASRFEPIALYRDWLLVGYATVYTMFPVFSLVLDKDVDEGLAKLYPELYKELTEGRSLSQRTFFAWVLVSIYQGSLIQGLSQILVGVEGPRMVSVSFTVLVINELVMVAFAVTTWHALMVFSILATALLYLASIPFLGAYFDLSYVLTVAFLWRVLAILSVSLVPPYLLKVARRAWKPPTYRKVRGV